jgi:hypothetical protein
MQTLSLAIATIRFCALRNSVEGQPTHLLSPVFDPFASTASESTYPDSEVLDSDTLKLRETSLTGVNLSGPRQVARHAALRRVAHSTAASWPDSLCNYLEMHGIDSVL